MLATNIQFPNIPNYPGVPQLLRPVGAVIASQPDLVIALGSLEALLGNAAQQAPRWGIFDAFGNQLGVSPTATLSAIATSLASLLSGSSAPVLSTFGFDYVKETRVSDFPIEGGGFASYNKVEMPANPIVTLSLSGSESDRTSFLNAIDAACKSTDLYSVVTPEVTYANYTVERYTYARRNSKGATLLMVEVSLKEIRTVQASFATVTPSPIVSPQNASATPQVNSGMTQPAAPETSVLKSIANKLGVSN